MATLDWHLQRADETTLVELVLTSDAPERVVLESSLEPVWPPRRQGVPVAGWDGVRHETTVGPDTRRVLGYASPAAPEEPPATVVDTEPVEAVDATTARHPRPTSVTADEVDARSVVRALGQAGPCRDVSAPSDCSDDVGTPTDPDHGQGTVVGRQAHQPDRTQQRRDDQRVDSGPDPDDGCPTDQDAPLGADVGGGVSEAEPDPVAALDAWIQAVDERLETAAHVTAADDATAARERIDAVGGLDALEALEAALDEDHRTLTRLRHRLADLEPRVESSHVPVDTLARLA